MPKTYTINMLRRN